MADEAVEKASETESSFEEQADLAQMGLLAEFWDFLRYNKKWWLTPIVLVLLMLGVLVGIAGIGGGGAAPFIYTIF